MDLSDVSLNLSASRIGRFVVLVSDDLSDLSKSFPILEEGAWKYPITSLNGGCCVVDSKLDGCLVSGGSVGRTLNFYFSLGRKSMSDYLLGTPNRSI